MKALDSSYFRNENGSVLLLVVLVLIAVTLLGIVATRIGYIEMDTATNDKVHKMTWFATDAGCQATTQLIEQNIEERGFGAAPVKYGAIDILTGDFYNNTPNSAAPAQNCPTAANRDIEMSDVGQSIVYVKVYGNTELSTGNALQIAAGDKGRGKGLAGGGAQIIYDIRSRGQGPADSQARILLRWRHLI